MKNAQVMAVFEALLAAVFYAINMPASKVLLGYVQPTIMAGLLYLGAGIGVYLLSNVVHIDKRARLTKQDLPYTIGMIVLDIMAAICLMFGLSHTTAASASLLNNFEIVATAVIAWAFFKEVISTKLWLAIVLVTISSILLSFERTSSLRFSWGAFFVLLSAICWGLENNCTRKIASKDTFEIVTLKGIFSGVGAIIIGLLIGQKLPSFHYGLLAMLLGFVAYGLSLYFYIKVQGTLGAAKTSAYYAIAPFIGALLSLIFLKEPLSMHYFVALGIMLLGSAIIIADTFGTKHLSTSHS